MLIFFFFFKAIQAAYRAEKIVNSSHRMMKDEEARRIAAMESLRVADKKSQKLTTKLTEVERDKRSAEAALDGAEKQVKA